MKANIIVLGAGISGLSSAIRLCEAGHSVTVWARDLPPQTTSDIAAAIWYPYKAFPEQLVLGWSATTFNGFAALEHDPSAGVRLREGIELFTKHVADPWWKTAVPFFRRAHAEELPSSYCDGYVFRAYVIEMNIYLPYLLRRLRGLGGRIEQRRVHTLAEALEASDMVVNCTGLGARETAPDPSMTPLRGQIVQVSQVGIERFTFDEHGPHGITYIVPRTDDIILGGVAEEGREVTEVEAETAQLILERCIRLEPRLAQAAIIAHRVGLRPGRPTVRLEHEQIAPGKHVVHNYGHGGSGVTLSWGCADEVTALVAAALGE